MAEVGKGLLKLVNDKFWFQKNFSEEIIRSSIDGIFAFDRQTRFIVWNPAIEKMSGLKASNVIGKLASDILPTFFEKNERKYFSAALGGKNIVAYDRPYRISSNGKRGFFEGHYSPLYDKNGRIVGGIAIIHDITDSKLSERRYERLIREKSARQQAQESTDRISAILESISDAFVSIDPQGNFSYVNTKAAQLLGKRKKKILGQPVDEIFPHILESNNYSKVLKAVNIRKAIAYEEFFPKFNKWFWIRVYPSKEGISVYFEDITPKKIAEQELRHSRDQLEVILKNVADGITVQRPDGSLIFANDAASTLIGFTNPQELLDSPITKIMDNFEVKDEFGNPYDLEKLPGRIALQSGEIAAAILQFVYKDSGEHRWAIVKASPVFEENGSVQFAINVFHDITETKEQEKRKDEFLGIASHELKTPLTSLKGFVQIVERYLKNTKDYKSLEYVRKMDSQLNKITNLIQDLLDVSKITSGKLDFNFEQVDLRGLTEDMITDFKAIAPEYTITVKGETRPKVRADRDRLGQVLTNLFTNAIKYSPESRKIQVLLKQTKKETILGVRDYGIGIPKRDREKIFERFYRVGEAKRRSLPGGLGLGLYISAEIISRHKGKIWVEEGKPKGSIFYFSIPK